MRAAQRESLLQRAMHTREHTLYEHFCDGLFFPCLIVEGGDAAFDEGNGVRVYMGNKDYVVDFKPCERGELVRSDTQQRESARSISPQLQHAGRHGALARAHCWYHEQCALRGLCGGL